MRMTYGNLPSSKQQFKNGDYEASKYDFFIQTNHDQLFECNILEAAMSLVRVRSAAMNFISTYVIRINSVC